MVNKPKRPAENYLNMPNHIRNIPKLGYGVKELLAHIYSFGRKGCWQSNETLGKMFFRSGRTISGWIGSLKKGRHILWVNGKGYYRTLYAKTHPDVIESATLMYRDREVSKAEVIAGQADGGTPRRKLPGDYAEKCEVTSQKPVIPPRRKLPPTNNTTKKETTEGTTATPSPLPAGGQAPALLQDRKNQMSDTTEQLKRGFGRSGGRRGPKLTDKQFEDRRQKVLRGLRSEKK